jgi:hypothetical protein
VLKYDWTKGRQEVRRLEEELDKDVACLLFVFTFHSKYHTNEPLKEFGDFKIGAQVSCTVKYTDDPVLLANAETVLQGMTDRLIEIGRYNGMERNVEKPTYDNLNGTIHTTDC